MRYRDSNLERLLPLIGIMDHEIHEKGKEEGEWRGIENDSIRDGEGEERGGESDQK